MDDFRIKFYGVRGSYPVTSPGASFWGGDTACVEVLVDNTRIIFDAGTGIIGCGQELIQSCPEQLNICLSHLHFDHYSGLAFFAPLFDQRCCLNLYGPELDSGRFDKFLKTAIASPFFPVDFDQTPSTKIYSGIDCRQPGLEYSCEFKSNVKLRALSAVHPRDGVLVYRLDAAGKSFVYATDVELGVQPEDLRRKLQDFCMDVDCLLLDSQYTEESYERQGVKGWGHSTVEMAAFFAQSCRAKSLVLFHHDPLDTQDVVEAKTQIASRVFSGSVIAAKQGVQLSI